MGAMNQPQMVHLLLGRSTAGGSWTAGGRSLFGGLGGSVGGSGCEGQGWPQKS